MLKIKDYSIIETEWIEEQIKVVKKLEGVLPKIAIDHILNTYGLVKSKLKPLIPIVENAFDKGLERGYSGYPNTVNHTKPNKEEYINNTIIE